MRIVQLLTASMAVCSLVAGYAAAQGVVQPIPDSQYYVHQESTQPSPSDVVPAVPVVVDKSKDDGVQKDGVCQKDDACQKCGACQKGWLSLGGCCLGDPLEIYPEDCRGIKIGGWTQIGYHSDNSIADGFNQYEDHVALHQQWLYAEKAADGSCGWDWGFRVDAMYGIDANNTQAFGNRPGRWDYSDSFQHGEYGFALPQAYVELARGDLSVIAGHFFTTIGYEVVASPDNFFYSHAFTMNNSEPFTHTGVLATWEMTDRLTIYAGWTLGWDTGFDQFGGFGIGEFSGGNNWLGGFSYELGDAVTFTYMSTYGDFGSYGELSSGDDSYSHSVVLDVAITERLNYVFQSDYLNIQDYVGFPGFNLDTIGINQYLIYTLNDCWAVGARAEWWKAEGVSINEATFGVNYRPHANVVLRPEVKYEWVPAGTFDQTIFGVDMVVTY